MKTLFLASLTLALPILSPLHLRADAPPTAVRIVNTGVDAEGLVTFRLEWTAISNATYLVQSRTNLGAGDVWRTVDALTPTSAVGVREIKGRSIPENSVEFFQLVLPQPEIFSVEPAVLAPGVPVDLYIIGQCFSSNDVLRINGIAQTNTVLQSSTLRSRPTFTPDVPGDYLFELVVAGQVRSSFIVRCADLLANPELVLQGPPTEPLASPSYQKNAQAARDLAVSPLRIGLNLGRTSGDPKDDDCGGGSERKVNSHAGEQCDNGLGTSADSLFSGQVSQQVVDLAVEGRSGYYISARIYSPLLSRTGASSNGWTSSYDVNIRQVGSNIVVSDGTGRVDTFKPDTNGFYTCAEFFREGTLSNNVFKLTFADTGYWEFNPLTATPSSGKLSKIVDRNGNMMFLSQDTSGRLTQIVDDLGRTNTVAYNTAGQLASITDCFGRTVTYEYYQGLPSDQGSAGDLKSVTSPPVIGTPNGNDFPAGKTVTYTYTHGYPVALDRQNHLLLSCVDALGVVSKQYTYDLNSASPSYLRCVSVQHWTNTPTMISYLPQTAAPSNQFSTLRCIVNSPVGDVTEIFYDARGRGVRLEEFTGRATPGVAVTDVSNRPAGKLRSSDPVSFVSRWSWNNDSLCTAEILPGGEQRQYIYESDFDKATHARKRADCRVVREIASSPVDLDGDGVADVTSRACYYTYDPRFGSGVAKDWSNTSEWYKWRKAVLDGKVDRRSISVIFHSDAGEEAGRNAINTKGTGGSLAQRTDSRIFQHKTVPDILRLSSGSTSMADHAINTKGTGTAGRSKGIVVKKPGSGMPAGKVNQTAGEECDNGFGNNFITSATDPRGNVTTGTYDANGNRVKVQFHWDRQSSAERDFSYDTHGQLAAVTNAPDANGYRRVDTLSYYSSGPQAGYLQSGIVDAGGLALTENYEYDARGNLTRCIDPRGNDTLYTYNALNQLVQASSAPLSNGGTGTFRIRTQFAFDANDNLTLVAEENLDTAGTSGTNPFWRTQFVYDGGQRLSGSCRDKNAALAQLCDEVQYNAADQVILYRSPEAVNGHDASNTVALAYDERGMLFRETDAPGSSVQSTTQCDYDANGNLTRVSEGLEGTPSITTMEYDGFAGFGSDSSQIMRGRGALNQCIQARGLSVSAPRANTATPLVTLSNPLYDIRSKRSASLVIASRSKQSEAKANVKKAYTSDRISKITDPMGNITTVNYDANDNLTVVRRFGETNDVPGTNGNIRLAESHYEYDGIDLLVRSRDSFFSLPTQSPIGDGERTTTFAHAPNSACTSVTDDLGHATTYAYDTACRLSSLSSPGLRTVYARFYDAAGNVTRTTQTDLPDLGGPPQVFAWTNVYDVANRCVSTTDNVGNTTSFAYDSRDNCVAKTDANGNQTVYSYDGLSRMVSFTCLQGAASTGVVLSTGQLAYNDNDNCISSTDANGNVTLQTYDSLDRLTQTTQADGTHCSLVWSPRSNLIQETDANGTVMVHTYDANDRCVSNHITPGAGVASTTLNETFAYDGCSRLVGFKDEDCDGSGDYDSLGNMVGETRNGHATLSTYDSIGDRLSLTYPGGRALAYVYDAFGRCTNVLESGASLFSFAYVGTSCLSKEICGNGVVSQIDRDGIVGTPNAAGDFGQGQISRVRHTLGISTVISKVTLVWDHNGNKTRRDDAILAPAIPRTNSMFLSYDGLNRLHETVVLQGPTLLRDTAYGLDAHGNRTNVTGAASCSGSYAMASTTPPSDFQMNQYTTTPCDTRTYDENGNLVNRSSAAGPMTYEYDYANRLVQVRALDFNTGSLSPVAAYRYDALGHRISKTVYSTGLPATREFFYDGEDVIEEGNGTVTTATYVTRCFGAGQPKPQTCDAMRRGGQDYYFHTDDQGNVLALTTTGGAVVERCDYDDYGAVTFLTSDGVPTTATSSAVGNPYCWHGLRLDPETDMDCDDGGVYVDTKTGTTLARAQDDLQRTGSIVQLLTRNNPWSMGGRSDAGNGNAGVFLSRGTKGSQVGGSDDGNGIAKAGPQLNIKASRVNIN